MNNRHRTWFIVLLLMGLALFPLMIHGAEIPEKSSEVVDDARLLSEQDIASLTREISEFPFSFHVYTFNSLGGQTIASLGSDVFTSWSLGADDVLLLIAGDEQEVHIETLIGSKIDQSIKQAPIFQGANNNYTQLLDEFFVPHAANGQMKQAIVSVMQQINIIKASFEFANEPTTTSPPVSKMELYNDMTRTILAVILFLVLFIIVLYQLTRRMHLKKERLHLIKSHDETLGTINQIAQNIEPMYNLTKGKSKAHLALLKEQHYELLQAASTFSKDIRSFSLPRWVGGRARENLDRLVKEEATFNMTAVEIEAQMKSFKEMDNETRDALKQCERNLDDVQGQLAKLSASLNAPLDMLHTTFAALKVKIDDGNNAIDFDPLQVKQLLETLPDEIDGLKQQCKRLAEQSVTLAGLPEQISLTKKKVNQLIEQEHLLTEDIQPNALIQAADAQIDILRASLLAGDATKTTAIIQQIDHNLAEAVEQINRAIQTRDRNKTKLHTIQDKLSRYGTRTIETLESEFGKLKLVYHADHWRDVPERIGQIASYRDMLEQQLPHVISLNEPHIQKYSEAAQLIDEMLQQLANMDENERYIRTFKSGLDQRYDGFRLELARLENKYSASESLMKQHRLQHTAQLNGLKSAVNEVFTAIQFQLTQTPRDITKLSTHIQLGQTAMGQLDNAVNQAVNEKLNAERKLQQERARRQQMNRAGRYGGGIGGSINNTSNRSNHSGRSSGGSAGWGSSSSTRRSSGGSSSWGGSSRSGRSGGGGSSFGSRSGGGGSSSKRSGGGGSKW